MASRGRRVGKAPSDPCYLELMLAGPGGGDICMLMATALVRASAKGAASMRRQSKMFRAAIDFEILVFMKEFQVAFDAAQLGYHFPVGKRFPKNARRSSDTLGFTDAHVSKRFEQEKKAWDAALGDVERFKEMASRVFHVDLGAVMIKAITLMSQEDPYYTHTRLYAVGVDTVHFYLAVGNGRCEVCNCVGTKCLRTGFTLFPSGHATPRLLYCGEQCVDKRSVNINMMAFRPLDVPSRTPKEVANNNVLLKAMLRHVGMPRPFDSDMLMTRMRRQRALGVPEFIVTARYDARYWLERHPTLPRDFPIVSYLNIPHSKAEMAKKDMERALKINKELDAFKEQKRLEKLMGHIDALLVEKGIPESGLSTVDDVNVDYPGVKNTIVHLLGRPLPSKRGDDEHALDSADILTVVDTVVMMVGPLRRHDQLLTGGRFASPHAYTYITGLCASGPHGRRSSYLSEYEQGLLDDAPKVRGWLSAHKGWHPWVTAMHAFDAIQWDKLFVTQTSPSRGSGGSSDPVDVENEPGRWSHQAVWRVKVGGGGGGGIGGVLIWSSYSRSHEQRDQSYYQEMYQSCTARLDELGIEADLPEVPSQQSIDDFVGCPGSMDDHASGFATANFLQLVARTMCYYVETRSMALDILTGNDRRSFVAAVAEAGLNVEALAAEAVATRMDTADCP